MAKGLPLPGVLLHCAAAAAAAFSSLKSLKVDEFFLRSPPPHGLGISLNSQDKKPGWLRWPLSFQDPHPSNCTQQKLRDTLSSSETCWYSPTHPIRNSFKSNRPCFYLCRKMGLHVYFVQGHERSCLGGARDSKGS